VLNSVKHQSANQPKYIQITEVAGFSRMVNKGEEWFMNELNGTVEWSIGCALCNLSPVWD